MDPRARKGVYLGHRPGVKGSLVFYVCSREIFVSRNILYHENIFPFKTHSPAATNHPISHAGYDLAFLDFSPLHGIMADSHLHSPTFANNDIALPLHTASIPSPSASVAHDSHASHLDIMHSSIHASIPHASTPLRRSTRIRRPPSYLQDFHCSVNSSTFVSSSSKKVLYPLSKYLSYSNLSPDHRHFILNISALEESKTHK